MPEENQVTPVKSLGIPEVSKKILCNIGRTKDTDMKEAATDKTKYRLAEAAKKCMASSGTDAMTVTQIVQTCSWQQNSERKM